MELFENELENVKAGYPKQGINEEMALANGLLYCESSIESLKNDMRDSNGRTI